jgi:DNA-binding response OmpR family regulator
MDGYAAKPIQPRTLLALIESLVESTAEPQGSDIRDAGEADRAPLAS